METRCFFCVCIVHSLHHLHRFDFCFPFDFWRLRPRNHGHILHDSNNFTSREDGSNFKLEIMFYWLKIRNERDWNNLAIPLLLFSISKHRGKMKAPDWAHHTVGNDAEMNCERERVARISCSLNFIRWLKINWIRCVRLRYTESLWCVSALDLLLLLLFLIAARRGEARRNGDGEALRKV